MGSSTYQSLIDQLVSERRFGARADRAPTPAMQWGIDHEAAARTWYSQQSGNHVEIVGFVRHRSLQFVGVSPDGFVGNRGLVEIKCPQVKAYRETVTRGRIPARYIWQVQGQLWVCERDFADFVCFHPNLGGLVIRTQRDEDRINRLQERCQQIEREVQRCLAASHAQPKTAPMQGGTSRRAPALNVADHLPQSASHRLSNVPWWVWVAAAVAAWFWLAH